MNKQREPGILPATFSPNIYHEISGKCPKITALRLVQLTGSRNLSALPQTGQAFFVLDYKLGFYQDDRHFIYYAYTRGAAGLNELLNYDGHPLAAAACWLSAPRPC